MKTRLRADINNLNLSDIYSLMLFILYKIKDVPEYAVLSELCYLLDGSNLTRLLTYFAGKTITIPTETEFVRLTNALLLYQYINIEGASLTDALLKLTALTPKEKNIATELYLKILPIIDGYNINRGQIQHGH